MYDNTLETLRIVALGFVIKSDAEGALTALGSAILLSTYFGLNRCSMANCVNSHSEGKLVLRLPHPALMCFPYELTSSRTKHRRSYRLTKITKAPQGALPR